MPLWLWLVSFAVVAWEGLVYRNGNRSVLMTVLFWAAVIGSVAIALTFGHRMTGLEQETQRRTKLPRTGRSSRRCDSIGSMLEMAPTSSHGSGPSPRRR